MDGGRRTSESAESIVERITRTAKKPRGLPHLYVLVGSPEEIPYMVDEHVPAKLHGHKIKARLEIGDYAVEAYAVSDTSDVDPDMLATRAVDLLYGKALEEGYDATQARLCVEKWTHRAYTGDATLPGTRTYLNNLLQNDRLGSASINPLPHNRETVNQW